MSVHTLVMAAGEIINEIINKICKGKGLTSPRKRFLDGIFPAKKDEVGCALNKARNFFKHASSGNPDETLEGFSDDQNLIAIIWASDGLRQLGCDIIEAKTFHAWVSVVAPHLVCSPPSKEEMARIFGDIENQPRNAQKQCGLDLLHFNATGKLPTVPVPHHSSVLK